MHKTFFRLDKEMSIAIISILAILFTFLSDYSCINGFISFLFVMVKGLIFILTFLIFYLLEKNELEFKKVAGIYTSYFIINLVVTVFTSISMVDGKVSFIFSSLFNLINLIILLSGVCIFVEQVFVYGNISSKVYEKTIMKIVYLLGNFISYPFLLFINKKMKKE